MIFFKAIVKELIEGADLEVPENIVRNYGRLHVLEPDLLTNILDIGSQSTGWEFARQTFLIEFLECTEDEVTQRLVILRRVLASLSRATEESKIGLMALMKPHEIILDDKFLEPRFDN